MTDLSESGAALPKTWKGILFLVCLLFVCVGLYWLWYTEIVPRLTRLSADFYYIADVVSKDNFWDEARQSFRGEEISVTTFSYEVVREEKEALTIKNVFDVRRTTGEKIFSVSRLYGIDPFSGKHMTGYGDRDRVGYLFAPKHLKQGSTFAYWHVNYDVPAPLVFVGIEDFDGLQVFHYVSRYTADQTADLGNLPGVGVEKGITLDIELHVWFEPVSGRLVNYEDRTTAYYYDLASGQRLHPWNRFTNTFTQDSVANQVRIAEEEKAKTILVENDMPLLLGIMLVVALGFVLRIYLFQFRPIRFFSELKMPDWGVIVILVVSSLLVLLGWTVSWEFLKRIGPDSVAMNPMTAVGFLLMGIALYLTRLGAKKLWALVPISLMCLIGLLRLGAVYFGLTYNVDWLLFARKLGAETIEPHMSSVTAVNFVLVGVVLIIRLVPRFGSGRVVSRGLAYAVLVCGMSGLIAYLFGGFNMLTHSLFQSMALPTILLFSLVGLWLTYEQEENKGQGILVGMILRRIGLLSVSFIPVVLVFSSSSFLQKTLDVQLETRFESQVSAIETAIVQRSNLYKNTLVGGEAFLAASQDVTRDEWKRFVTVIANEAVYPGAITLSYVGRVVNADKTNHEEKVRTEGFPNYAIWPAGEREEYFPVVFIEPFAEDNLRAFGFDIASEPVRRAALVRARDSGDPVLTGTITLVQDDGRETKPGFLLLVPFYRNDLPTQTVVERQAALVGFITSPFHVDDFMEGIVNSETTGVDVEIYDGAIDPSKGSRIYETVDEQRTPAGYVPQLTKTRTVYVAGYPWQVHYRTRPEFRLSFLETIVPRFVLGGGLIFCGGLLVVIYGLVLAKKRALNLAGKMTEDIVIFKKAIETSSNHIIFTTPDGTVTYANDAAAKMTGFSKQELLGSNPRMWGGKMPKDFYVKLWDTIKHKRQTFVGEIVNHRKNGDLYSAIAVIAPIVENNELKGFVASETDISKLKEKEAEILARSSELEKLNKLMVGRELRMVELKDEMRRLQAKLKT